MDGFHEGVEVGLDVVDELGEKVGVVDGSNVDWVDGLQLGVVGESDEKEIVLGEVERVILG